MARTEIRFSGFGGQGILLAGIVLAKSASIFAGKSAVQTQSYGTEARGGASKCEVVIDDEEVDSPIVTVPDVFVVMSQMAYDQYINSVKPGGVVFYDSDLVKIKDVPGITQKAVPATKTAMEVLNKKMVANIVMLGAVVAGTGLVNMDQVKQGLEDSVKAEFVNINYQALEEGAKLVS